MLLQKILIQKFLKFLFVLVAHGDEFLAKHNAATLNHFNLIEVDNERTMHAHELRLGKFALDGLNRAKRKNGLSLALDEYLYVIFQPFDVKDVVEIDAANFVLRLQKEKLTVGLHSCCRCMFKLNLL